VAAILKPGQTQTELLSDIGLGRQVATLVAQQITAYLQHQGQRPDALLLTQQRFTQGNRPQRSVILDSQNRTATHYAPCCTPVPGDAVLGYLGHGDGLHIHRSDCPEAQRCWSASPSGTLPWNGARNPQRASVQRQHYLGRAKRPGRAGPHCPGAGR